MLKPGSAFELRAARFQEHLFLNMALERGTVDIHALAKQHAPWINLQIANAEGGRGRHDFQIQIQCIADGIVRYIKKHGLCKDEERIEPQYVGAHPANRMGVMLDATHVQELLQLFVRKGFALSETKLALGCEVPPAGTEFGKIAREKNKRLIQQTSGHLAPLNEDLMRILTVVNSHTSAALRIVRFADTQCIRCVRGCESELAGDDPAWISQDAILARCPSLREPSQHGILYTVIYWPVVEQCPGLMEILAESDHAKHSVYCRGTAIQTLMKIHRLAVITGDNADYVLISKLAARGQSPQFQDDCHHYAAFVRNYSGGDSGSFLHEIDAFAKTLPVSQVVPAEFFGKLAAVQFSQAQHVIIAMVKATISGPEKCKQGGVMRVFNKDDLKNLKGTLKPEALRAEALMKHAREFAGVACCNIDHPRIVSYIGQLDVSLVLHVFKKTGLGRPTYKSLTEIASLFHTDMVRDFPSAASIPVRRPIYQWNVTS